MRYLQRLFLVGLAASLSSLSACSGGGSKGNTTEDRSIVPPVSEEDDSPLPGSVWFEPLLGRATNAHLDVPHTSVFIQPIPGEDAFFMLGRNGGIHRFDRSIEKLPLRGRDDARATVDYDGEIVKVQLPNTFADGDLGSIGFSLDPAYPTNRFVYVWWVDKGDTTVYLDRLTWNGTAEEILASKVNIIQFPRKAPQPYHMGGIVQFLPDGTLILTPGDNEIPTLAQDPSSFHGKFLRIRPGLGPDGGYTVPPDNPYVGREGFLPEIYCFGVRAPFRGFWHGHELIFGDVGSVFEEIDVWNGEPTNFGWGRKEIHDHGISDGFKVVEGDQPPIVAWDAKEAARFCAEDPEYAGETRLSAAVGLVYSGRTDRYEGRITGKLLFFDIMRGFIRAGSWKGADQRFHHRHFGSRPSISHMIEGADGYIYCCTFGGGTRLWRIRDSDEN